jgi:hypothetical protein
MPAPRHPRLALLAALALAAAGCYERKQAGVLNPDGSGKVVIETDVAVPAAGAPGQQKPTAESFGRQLAAEWIDGAQGVDAWSDVSVSRTADGRARITATAYFPDVSRVRFDGPLAVSWRRQEDGAYRFAVERPRSPVPPAAALTAAEVKEQVARAQAQYKDQQLALQTALSTFALHLAYRLPGEVTESRVLAKEGRTVSLTLDGKKLAAALDQFMADDAAVAATIAAGRDLTENDDFLLAAMYGQKGPIAATVRVPADALPAFDYAAQVRAARDRQPAMLKAAGVELSARPAGPPATRPE